MRLGRNNEYIRSSRRSRQHNGCNENGGKDYSAGKDNQEPSVRFFLLRLFFLFHGCSPVNILPGGGPGSDNGLAFLLPVGSGLP